MSTSVQKETYVIGGMEVTVYREQGYLAQAASLLFLLHGRGGSKAPLERLAINLVLQSQKETCKRALLVATLDHRNHGTRLLDDTANNGWNEGPGQNNIRHAIDMYSIQVGTAQDVSFLIDFLPSYLSPNGELVIEVWGVAGISLGGHSTWLSLAHDKRIKVGVSIIGCPDYMELMRHRAAQNRIPVEAPYFPQSLLKLIKETDPSNGFVGKKILVLSGGDDEAVPWAASKQFVEKLWVGVEGVKTVKVYPGVGHKCTTEMEDELFGFVLDTMLLT